ncbi:MAG TPA: CBS domain-containing protein [Anaerolineales bacterium]|nr:CBS domain-containing protein [Anaerolineales bacterium]
MKISDILAQKGGQVFTIRPDQTIHEALQVLVSHNIGGLVVLDENGKIVGVLTERDVLRFVAAENPDFSTAVHNVMTKNVIIGAPQDDLHSVAHTMTEKRFRHLPVVEKGKLMGIVTIGDVLKAQRDSYQGQVYTLQTMIIAEE